MIINDELNHRNESYRNKLERLRPIDDEFMRIVFRNNIPLAQRALQIITENADLRIIRMETQADIKLPGFRSIMLDVLCQSRDNVCYNMEVEKSTDGADIKRARYHASALDVKQLRPREQFFTLHDVCIVFITEKDVQGQNLPRYYIRGDPNAAEHLSDGTSIIFANAQYQDDTEFGRLMADFLETEPEKMSIREMRETCFYYKRTEEGRQYMSAVFEEIRAEGKAEGKAEGRFSALEIMSRRAYYPDETSEETARAVGCSVEEVESVLSYKPRTWKK